MKKNFDTYTEIKERILSLDYRPGSRLSEARLAVELGVGRSPIRTALKRLEVEGWVNVLPQSGTIVAEFGVDDVVELCELRMLLEAHVARIATERLDNPTLQSLRAMFDALAGEETKNITSIEVFDDIFHKTLYEHAENGLIQTTLMNLRDQIRWIRRANSLRSCRVAESLAEMGAVLAALEARDSTAAANLMETHIRNIGVAYRQEHEKEKNP
ncbi:GntR family transcriptional regulator [Billgrantia endophytica]|uniref:HTH gntR-type domain-containing protein n=1 Tax=Billgrantia endophytica TaxID=2033802 RepID=A0A2N7UBS2_9GAMM|nr:GntR family transcriptional regulator [Halomonas endophytica]PMR77889.1 hypothetical protein C1H69_00825 [Halomonas endophytica]